MAELLIMSISQTQIDNKILTALKKCEAAASVEPPNSEMLISPTMLLSTSPSIEENRQSHTNKIESKCKRSPPSSSTHPEMESEHNRLNTRLSSSSRITATALSSAPTISGLPRFSIDIDQQLKKDHLTIGKGTVERETVERRLTYLADFYHRELVGIISWAKHIPGTYKIE